MPHRALRRCAAPRHQPHTAMQQPPARALPLRRTCATTTTTLRAPQMCGACRMWRAGAQSTLWRGRRPRRPACGRRGPPRLGRSSTWRAQVRGGRVGVVGYQGLSCKGGSRWISFTRKADGPCKAVVGPLSRHKQLDMGRCRLVISPPDVYSCQQPAALLPCRPPATCRHAALHRSTPCPLGTGHRRRS